MKNTLIIDGDCGICTHFGNYLKTFDIRNNFDLITLSQVQNNIEINQKAISLDNINFVSEKGNYYTQVRAVSEAMKLSSGIFKLFGIFSSNPFISFIFKPIYILVRNNRTQISKILGYKACEIRYNLKK